MKKTFHGTTLEECLNSASSNLNIDKDEIIYNIIEVKKGFFHKSATISVDIPDKLEVNNIKEGVEEQKLNVDGVVNVKDGIICVTNPKKSGKPAAIAPGEKLRVIVDGEEINAKKDVFEESEIEVILPGNEESRSLDINISNNKMEAYISVKYIPEETYVLEDVVNRNQIELKAQLKCKKISNKFTIQEIYSELSKRGVIYGIIKENVGKCIEKECINELIAKGKEPINEEDDKIDIKFNIDEKNKKLTEDETGKVDFKSIGIVETVNKGDVLAVKVLGKKGSDGKDVFGKTIKHKLGKKMKLKIGEGCEFKDSETVVAAVSGKPSIKGNNFCVHQIYEVRGDVDLKTGNIKFLGDIIVYGNVNESMRVEAGHSVTVEKNIERAEISAKGDIIVKGNIIASCIVGGGKDVAKLDLIENLNKMKNCLTELFNTITEIKKFNLLGDNKKDGEIIKLLIENKFRILNVLSLKVITGLKIVDDEEGQKVILPLIKGKLIGLAPINIKHYSELEKIINLINERIIVLEDALALPINVNIRYCQDSNVSSSGNVVISGKGEYVSNITANDSVRFQEGKGVARGGVIKAKREIRCKIVGSIGGVSTRLIVEKHGHIWADTAYQNTRFIVGQREFLLEVPSKSIHAYMNDEGEIIVDKLIL